MLFPVGTGKLQVRKIVVAQLRFIRPLQSRFRRAIEEAAREGPKNAVSHDHDVTSHLKWEWYLMLNETHISRSHCVQEDNKISNSSVWGRKDRGTEGQKPPPREAGVSERDNRSPDAGGQEKRLSRLPRGKMR